jgi:hypothetical protein
VIPFLLSVEDLFPSFSRILIEVAVGIADKQDCGSADVGLVDWPPAQRIDWSWLFASCRNLGYFIICA